MRSKYPRKSADIGPTVAGQDAYMWPEDFVLPLSVAVAGTPWESAPPETVKQYANGVLTLNEIGVWYEKPGEDGLRKLRLYPAPSGGDSIEVEWVYRPVPLTVAEPNGVPSELPEEFHKALLSEASATYYETVEDNPELSQRHSERADLWVNELARYDNERRAGSGIFRIPIAGVTG